MIRPLIFSKIELTKFLAQGSVLSWDLNKGGEWYVGQLNHGSWIPWFEFDVNGPVVIITISPCFRYKNGKEVGSAGRCRAHQKDDIYTLDINEIYDNDGGEIACEIYNQLGKEKCSCTFEVECKLLIFIILDH